VLGVAPGCTQRSGGAGKCVCVCVCVSPTLLHSKLFCMLYVVLTHVGIHHNLHKNFYSLACCSTQYRAMFKSITQVVVADTDMKQRV